MEKIKDDPSFFIEEWDANLIEQRIADLTGMHGEGIKQLMTEFLEPWTYGPVAIEDYSDSEYAASEGLNMLVLLTYYYKNMPVTGVALKKANGDDCLLITQVQLAAGVNGMAVEGAEDYEQ